MKLLSRLFTLGTAFCLSLVAHSQVVSWTSAPQWDKADALNNDLIRVMNDGEYGVIRADGSEILPCSYAGIMEMSDNSTVILAEKGRLKAILDDTGNVKSIQDELYVDVSWPYFSEGMLAVRNSSNEWGYMNRDGILTIPCSYIAAFPFFHGQAAVSYKGGWWTHITHNGNESPVKDILAGKKLSFASSYVPVKGQPMAVVCCKGILYMRDLNGSISKDFMIDLDGLALGQKIAGPSYSLEFSDCGKLHKIDYKNSSLKFDAGSSPQFISDINTDIDRINLVSTQYDSVKTVSSHSILVKKGNKWGVLGYDESKVIKVEPTVDATDFYHSMAKVPFKMTLPTEGSYEVSLYKTDEEGKLEVITPENGIFQVPVSYNEDTTSVRLALEVNGVLLKDKEYKLKTRLKNKQGFSLSVSSSEKVSPSGKAGFNIYIRNKSSQECGRCKISVDGAVLKELDGLAPSERKTLRKNVTVNLADEDNKKMVFVIRIEEEGMKPVTFRKEVVFEKTFKNE